MLLAREAYRERTLSAKEVQFCEQTLKARLPVTIKHPASRAFSTRVLFVQVQPHSAARLAGSPLPAGTHNPASDRAPRSLAPIDRRLDFLVDSLYHTQRCDVGLIGTSLLFFFRILHVHGIRKYL